MPTNSSWARNPNSAWPLPCERQPSVEEFNNQLKETLNFNKERTLSHWYMAENPQAYALVVHGLNLNPKKMESFIQVLNNQNISVLLVSLTGHRGSLDEQKDVTWQQWLDDMHLHFCDLKKKAKGLPLYHLSFSLGSLTTLGYLSQIKDNPFQKNVLIAPAGWIHWYSKIPQYLGFFSRRFGLPSGNLKEYRSQDTTSLGAYAAMAEGRELLEKTDSTLFQRPTLVILDPDDELVSLKKLRQYILNHDLKNWKILTVSNKNHNLKKSFHHLIVDEASLGKRLWMGLSNKIETFFRVKSSPKDQ